MGSTAQQPPASTHQNVVVMRHGDRLDEVVPLWTSTTTRPWDPPLEEDGRVRAFCTGRRLRSQLGFPIHRVFVSPFLRCLQTAAEVVAALCAVADKSDDPNDLTSNNVVIDPFKIKVSIEYGLCEMLNSMTVRPDVAPKDGNFRFDMSQCEAVLPSGTVDRSIQKVYKEMPKWPETVEGARARYTEVIKALADKYPKENLLLVTHGKLSKPEALRECSAIAELLASAKISAKAGDGVGTAVSGSVKDVDAVYLVDYCGYSLLQRPIFSYDNKSFKAGEFVGQPEKQAGIKYTMAN